MKPLYVTWILDGVERRDMVRQSFWDYGLRYGVVRLSAADAGASFKVLLLEVDNCDAGATLEVLGWA